jgi:hypothetical protein
MIISIIIIFIFLFIYYGDPGCWFCDLFFVYANLNFCFCWSVGLTMFATQHTLQTLTIICLFSTAQTKRSVRLQISLRAILSGKTNVNDVRGVVDSVWSISNYTPLRRWAEPKSPNRSPPLGQCRVPAARHPTLKQRIAKPAPYLCRTPPLRGVPVCWQVLWS